jgi:hypothetical protein
MAIKFPATFGSDADLGMLPAVAVVNLQKQNGDLLPSTLVPAYKPEDGDLGMDPIADFEPRPVPTIPFKNLRQK